MTKYSGYEYKHGGDGILYIMPKPDAKPIIYDPLKDGEAMVIDALNIERVAMRENSEKGPGEKLKQSERGNNVEKSRKKNKDKK